MTELSPQQADVLRHALSLGTFTAPDLAVESEVSYATVRETLAREDGVTVRVTGNTAAASSARSSAVWEVIDAAVLEARLGAVAEAATAAAPAEREDVRLARMLAAAEDRVLMALRSHAMEDAAELAQQALIHLAGTEAERISRAEPEAESAPLVDKRNLPPLEGRALIIGSIAAYLTSAESAGLSGQLWRHAFRTLAAIDLPDHATLQKAFLVELVRVVDERAEGTPLVERLAHAAGDGDGLRRFVVEQGTSGREALQGALALLLSRQTPSTPGDPATLRLCELAGELFREGAAGREDITERVVGALRRLAFLPDAEVARHAQGALLAIGRPREEKFWRGLAHAQHPAPLALIIECLGRFDLDAAFALLEEMIGDEPGFTDAEVALAEALPALASQAPNVVEEHFTNFVAALPREQRSRLSAVPARAGLEWRLSMERPLAGRLFERLARWRRMLEGRYEHAPASRQLATLGDEVIELTRETLLSLSPGEQRHARELLTGALGDCVGAAVGVRALLSVGGESDIAQALVRHSEFDPAETVGRWYLDTLPREGLGVDERQALVTAVYDALRRDEKVLSVLARRAAEIGDELPEVFDNGDIDMVVRGRLMAADYRARPDEDRAWLKEFAQNVSSGD